MKPSAEDPHITDGPIVFSAGWKPTFVYLILPIITSKSKVLTLHIPCMWAIPNLAGSINFNIKHTKENIWTVAFTLLKTSLDESFIIICFHYYSLIVHSHIYIVNLELWIWTALGIYRNVQVQGSLGGWHASKASLKTESQWCDKAVLFPSNDAKNCSHLFPNFQQIIDSFQKEKLT